jgi:succinate dehydrogenase / fumarate reductase, cytochrome b subunit
MSFSDILIGLAIAAMFVVPTPARSTLQPHGAAIARTALAASGFVMLGFVIVHLGGNLVAFAGSGPFNSYARGIRELSTPVVGEGVFLLAARVVLGMALMIHLLAHVYLKRHRDDVYVSSAGADSRPLPPWYATLPLSVLQASGGTIALFLVVHLLQLTVGAAHPVFDPNDPYRNMVVALQLWPVSLMYILAAAAVGVHLLPGLWTGMDSLGLIRPRTERLASALSPAVALLVAIGLAAAPLAIATNMLK